MRGQAVNLHGHIHELKCRPDAFKEIWEDRKTCELRRDDRGFEVGHLLLLREFDPDSVRSVIVRVTHIIRAGEWPGLEEGFVIMSLCTVIW